MRHVFETGRSATRDLLAAMSVKELKDVAKAVGVSLAGVSEKQEIVNLVKARIEL